MERRLKEGALYFRSVGTARIYDISWLEGPTVTIFCDMALEAGWHRRAPMARELSLPLHGCASTWSSLTCWQLAGPCQTVLCISDSSAAVADIPDPSPQE